MRTGRKLLRDPGSPLQRGYRSRPLATVNSLHVHLWVGSEQQLGRHWRSKRDVSAAVGFCGYGEGLLNAFNAHDLDAVMEFFSDDCSLDMPRGPEPWGQRFVGKAAVREGLATRFWGLPDVHYGDARHCQRQYDCFRVDAHGHKIRRSPGQSSRMRPL